MTLDEATPASWHRDRALQNQIFATIILIVVVTKKQTRLFASYKKSD